MIPSDLVSLCLSEFYQANFIKKHIVSEPNDSDKLVHSFPNFPERKHTCEGR
jgi:hypothetical protein